MRINKKNLLCAMVNADMNNQKLSQETGISVNQISNIRQGRGSTYDTACKIAKALNVPVQELIDLEGSEDEQ